MDRSLKILNVVASVGLGSFFFDDQSAIKAGAIRDGAVYIGEAITPGYTSVREPSESVSIMLVLSDGYVAIGDCASVQYSGVGGREPRFHAELLVKEIQDKLSPHLIGMEVNNFRASAIAAEKIINDILISKKAVAYGVSQALLDAASHAAGHHLKAKIIQDEWELKRSISSVPIYGQSGDDRYTNVDKMILKQVPVLPHGLINTLELVGEDGVALKKYILWIKERINAICNDDNYLPIFHLDVYGMIGVAANGDVSKVADIIASLEEAAFPHTLRIEHPIHADNIDSQISTMVSLRRELKSRGSQVAIIADEWANTIDDIRKFISAKSVDMIQIKTPDLGSLHNTIDAILECHAYGVGTVLGGTCAETDVSARSTTHIGVATGVYQMLAKPGMGFDEGYTIVLNEMNRAIKLNEFLTGNNE